jgi:hypothetical protein
VHLLPSFSSDSVDEIIWGAFLAVEGVVVGEDTFGVPK